MTVNLIGLYSPAVGCGKTELTNQLVRVHGYTPVKFAGTLKAMLRVLLEDAGATPVEAIRFTDGDLKEAGVPGLGCSTRRLMQTLGTDWGRTLIKPTLWIDVARAKIQRLLRDGRSVVVDDVRFPNEYGTIKALGGVNVRVDRPGLQDPTGHASEGLLDKHHFDYALVNSQGLEEWRLLASHFHETLGARRQESQVVG